VHGPAGSDAAGDTCNRDVDAAACILLIGVNAALLGRMPPLFGRRLPRKKRSDPSQTTKKASIQSKIGRIS
jgi:hypothetical protein